MFLPDGPGPHFRQLAMGAIDPFLIDEDIPLGRADLEREQPRTQGLQRFRAERDGAIAVGGLGFVDRRPNTGGGELSNR